MADAAAAVDRSSDNAISRIASRLRGLSNWARHLCCLLLGALAATALAPFYFIPVLLISFTGLLWLLDGARTRLGAFACGWWFGFGHFLAGLWWIGNAFLVEADRFGWMVPFAVAGLAAGLAIFPALAVLAVRLAAPGTAPGDPGRVLLLAAAWTAAEWLRGIVLTGFPWNPIGQSWAFDTAPIQLAAVTGVFGLSVTTVAIAAAPAILARSGRAAPVALAAAALAVAALWLGGAWRLDLSPRRDVAGVTLGLVQPDVPQTEKWQPALQGRNLARLMALSRMARGQGATHLVWPETAVPWSLATSAGGRSAVAAAAPPGGLVLTGALRYSPRGSVPQRAWNSFYAVDSSARLVATYDKIHLVPFGEYVPLASVLPMQRLAPGRGSFSAGIGPRTLDLPGLPPVGVLICYEVIFPGDVADPARRPDWLLNVTNDAWFGISPGPYQHFDSARLRAVEEGLPVIRAANTGISAVIDGNGRIVSSLGLGRQGSVNAPLPRPLAVATPFARFGGMVPGGLIVLAGLAGIAAAWRERLGNQSNLR